MPLLRGLPLSLQHLCAMFGATVLVPFLLKVDPATSLLMNGAGTLASGASITIGTVALKGMALGTVVAIVLSLLLAAFDRLGLANDTERPALPERM